MPLDELYTKPGHLIRRMQQIAVAIFMEECAAFDLTPVQYAALVAVREYPGIDATRLAAVIAFDRSTIGNVIGRLEVKGFLLRKPSDEDGRAKLLYLTATGKKTIAAAAPFVERAQHRILGDLSAADRRKLMQLLTQLVDLNNERSRAPQRALASAPANSRGVP